MLTVGGSGRLYKPPAGPLPWFPAPIGDNSHNEVPQATEWTHPPNRSEWGKRCTAPPMRFGRFAGFDALRRVLSPQQGESHLNHCQCAGLFSTHPITKDMGVAGQRAGNRMRGTEDGADGSGGGSRRVQGEGWGLAGRLWCLRWLCLWQRSPHSVAQVEGPDGCFEDVVARRAGAWWPTGCLATLGGSRMTGPLCAIMVQRPFRTSAWHSVMVQDGACMRRVLTLRGQVSSWVRGPLSKRQYGDGTTGDWVASWPYNLSLLRSWKRAASANALRRMGMW